MGTIEISSQYGYVALTAAACGFLTAWQGVLVTSARGRAKIGYPCAYASKELADRDFKAMVFNCTQRAHQNTLEWLPTVLATLLFSGLFYPKLATGFGVVWILGRVAYTLGYCTGDPRKRARGTFGHIGECGLLFTTLWAGVKLVGKGV